jgi:hypothetical protein
MPENGCLQSLPSRHFSIGPPPFGCLPRNKKEMAYMRVFVQNYCL